MKRRKELWHDNSGFTLLELLIVMAISIVLLSLVTVTIAVVNNADANKAARTFSTVIARARAESMAKGTDAGQLTITMEGGRLLYQLGDPATAPKEEISSAMIGVEVVYNDSTDAAIAGTTLTDGFTYTIRFSTSGLVERPAGADILTKLIFSRGNRRVSTVLYSTGKNETKIV